MTKRLLFVVNVDWFFVSHRLPVALAAIDEGYEVHLATRFTGQQGRLRDQGIICHDVGIERSSGGVWSALKLVAQLRSLYARLQPDIIHLVTIKPVLLGGLATRLSHVDQVVASVSGLGFVFLARGFRAILRRRVVSMLYGLALGKKGMTVIVQNVTDEAFIRRIAGRRDLRTVLVPGSGVDLTEFSPQDLPPEPVRVLMASRLLGDKGVREYVGAARILAAKGARVRLMIAGEIDPGNPASIAASEVEAWRLEGHVEFCGQVRDMAQLIASCHIAVLPSYREGMPKFLIEAAACGRAVVTTDVPGCRDAVLVNESGILVAPRDEQALALAIEKLAADPERMVQMGDAGRRLAEARFDIAEVTRAHLRIYAGGESTQ